MDSFCNSLKISSKSHSAQMIVLSSATTLNELFFLQRRHPGFTSLYVQADSAFLPRVTPELVNKLREFRLTEIVVDRNKSIEIALYLLLCRVSSSIRIDYSHDLPMSMTKRVRRFLRIYQAVPWRIICRDVHDAELRITLLRNFPGMLFEEQRNGH